MAEIDIARLRAVDEDTVAKALEGAYVDLPIKDHASLVEAFNCILDELTTPDGFVTVPRMRLGLLPEGPYADLIPPLLRDTHPDLADERDAEERAAKSKPDF